MSLFHSKGILNYHVHNIYLMLNYANLWKKIGLFGKFMWTKVATDQCFCMKSRIVGHFS